jgi:hypothetical protein
VQNLCPKDTYHRTLIKDHKSFLLSTSLSHHKTYDLLSTNTLIIMHACMPLPFECPRVTSIYQQPHNLSRKIWRLHVGKLHNTKEYYLSLFFLHKMLFFLFFRKTKYLFWEFQHLYTSVISVKAAKVLHCIRMSLPDQLGFGVADLVILLTTLL